MDSRHEDTLLCIYAERNPAATLRTGGYSDVRNKCGWRHAVMFRREQNFLRYILWNYDYADFPSNRLGSLGGAPHHVKRSPDDRVDRAIRLKHAFQFFHFG